MGWASRLRPGAQCGLMSVGGPLMNQPVVSRRAFAGAAVASSLARVQGAGERISVGLIGVGGRGQYVLGEIVKC